VRRHQAVRRYGLVLLFMAPWLIGFALFTFYPMAASLFYSFTRYNVLEPPVWVGLDNYRFMFDDPLFWRAIKNTAWIVVFLTALEVVFGIVIASLVVTPRRGIRAYRTIFYLPTMVPPVAGALAFLYLLNPATGPVNQLLGFLHLPEPLWFYDPRFAKPGLLLLGLWSVGQAMIIFMAALLDVPKELYEAADLESANRFQKFRHITLPMISPVIFFSVVIGVIYGFQYFTQAYVAARTTAPGHGLGEPQGSLLFYTVYLFGQAFTQFHMGYASAMAWMLFLITLVCVVVMLKVSRRWVYYGGGFFGR
jgi:multiple sugar transport system permease protein